MPNVSGYLIELMISVSKLLSSLFFLACFVLLKERAARDIYKDSRKTYLHSILFDGWTHYACIIPGIVLGIIWNRVLRIRHNAGIL